MYKVGMFVEGLAEKWRGVNQGLERARAGVNLLLHDERASERWRNIGRNVGRGLAVVTGMAVGCFGTGYGMIAVMEKVGYPDPNEGLLFGLKVLGLGVIEIGGMLVGSEIAAKMVGLRSRSRPSLLS